MSDLIVDSSKRWAITIAAGGAKVAWAFGFLLSILSSYPQLLNQIVICYGTSAGSLASAALGHCVMERNQWPMLQAQNAIIRMCNYGFNAQLLEDVVIECLPDNVLQRLIQQAYDPQAPIEVGACAANIRTLRGEMFTTRQAMTPDRYRQALMASAAIPGILPPVQFDGVGDAYVDGAVTDLNPSGFLGLTSLMRHVTGVIRLDYKFGKPKVSDKLGIFLEPPTVAARAISYAASSASKRYLGIDVPSSATATIVGLLGQAFTREGSSTRRLTESYSRQEGRLFLDIPVLQFCPSIDLDLDALDFHEDKIRRAIAVGHEDALKTFHWSRS